METSLNRAAHSSVKNLPIKDLVSEAQRRLERLGPDQFELYFQRKISTKIESKDQQVDSVTRAEDVGMAVRIVKDRRMGFSFTTSLTQDAIARAVESAMNIAQVMPEDEFIDLPSFGTYVYPAVDAFDPKGIATPVAQKAALAQELEAVCRAADARIKGVRSAAFSESIHEVHLVDSNGEQIQHQGTVYGVNITCKAEEAGDNQVGHEMDFSNYLDNLDVKNVGTLAARWATELLQAKAAPTMICPAILRNSVVADLVDFVSASFSAEEIDKGRSMLAGKKGELLFSDKVTLIDDGLLAGGLGTSPFDAEGIPSSRNVLVDGGFISGTLYDAYYARKYGAQSTGNAVRGLKSPPSIGTTNLFMQNGKRAMNQLLDGIAKGILITDLMGVHTANPVTGDFSLGASGILIENGRLTQPVRGFAVAGNVLDLFRKMTDIGDDLRFFGTVGAPSVRISEISVGGK